MVSTAFPYVIPFFDITLALPTGNRVRRPPGTVERMSGCTPGGTVPQSLRVGHYTLTVALFGDQFLLEHASHERMNMRACTDRQYAFTFGPSVRVL